MIFFRIFLGIWLLTSGFALFAQASTPSPALVRNLCAAVSAQSEVLDPVHSAIMYQYENLIAVEAGVRPSDTRTEFNEKMRNWVNRNMQILLCDGFNFSPQRGNILKIAISSSSDSFVDDAVRVWGVNLNQVDQVDHLTVLDYIEERRVNAGNNINLIRIYTRYYDRFRSAGARHARELSQ